MATRSEPPTGSAEQSAASSSRTLPQPLPLIGLVYALDLEIGPFKKRLRDKRYIRKDGSLFLSGYTKNIQFILARCGIGQALSYETAKKLLQNFKPSRIISAGFAGALDEGLKIADVVLSSVATSDHVVRTSNERHELKKKTQAKAVDMESSGVERAAGEYGVGFLSVKVISDIGDDLALRRILFNPFRLPWNYFKARQKLAAALSQMGLEAIEYGNAYSDKGTNENLNRRMPNKLL